ncbi:THUMP-like domain-containing protein [Spirosoma sp.]|uniref:THUMP-like domain-containing protein n=1 Tax=Spirosoma sp. TaxID=1899569 RepID=UPI003B3A03ED
MQTFLSAAEREFIRDHLTNDVRGLLLRKNLAGLDLKRLVAQIASRQKAREKLPTWYANDALIFPPALSVEQASSERTAHYKALLVSGNVLLDLTGGMGVDTWAFAQRVGQVIYVERNAELAKVSAYNLTQLGVANVTVYPTDGLSLLDNEASDWLTEPADWIYLDPHRRDEQGGKVIRLEDCEPDLSKAQTISRLLKKANQVLLKTSPLLDIDATVRQLNGAVDAVHVVAVQGEVKEVLFVLGKQNISLEAVQIQAVNLLPDRTVRMAFRWYEERTANVSFGDPQQYIYEPNAAVLKAGAFRLVAERFELTKLAPNSHLYTSNVLRTDFPGRVFRLQAVLKPDVKTLKTEVPALKANLTVRNFPQSVAELRKKLNLREGGDIYILATTLLNTDKRLLITRKVESAH